MVTGATIYPDSWARGVGLSLKASFPGLQSAHPLLFPTGREANTIHQLLADENMRKQNEYVEVRAKGVKAPLQKAGGGRPGPN